MTFKHLIKFNKIYQFFIFLLALVQEASPLVQEASPVVQESSPLVQDASLPAQDAPESIPAASLNQQGYHYQLP